MDSFVWFKGAFGFQFPKLDFFLKLFAFFSTFSLLVIFASFFELPNLWCFLFSEPEFLSFGVFRVRFSFPFLFLFYSDILLVSMLGSSKIRQLCPSVSFLCA